ncbi:hypothetical protein T484DRAFT_1833428 [Baffinella frigidus]|nr:hypothetical protein T484DRAFT_1833428 [Cryptophyta sp. CCMP2293]
MSNVNGVEMQPAGDASRKASTSESEHDTEAAHSGTGTGGELKPLVEDDIDSPLGGRNSVFRGMTRVHCCALICCLLVLFGVLAGVGIFLLGHWNASVSNLTEAQESSSAGKGSGASVELAPPVGLEDVNLVVAKLVEDLTQGPGKGAAWAMTAEFVDTFGHRQAGSENLERSIDWLAAFCRDAGFDRVYHENVSGTTATHS